MSRDHVSAGEDRNNRTAVSGRRRVDALASVTLISAVILALALAAVAVAVTPPPTLTGSNPPSPANDNSPFIQGTTATTSEVSLYTNSSCEGTPVATGVLTDSANPGIRVSVPDDSTTTFYGTATAGDDTVSPCSSSSVTYVESSSPPPPPPPSPPSPPPPPPPSPPSAPTFTATDPASPANDNSPLVRGNAASDSTVRLYPNADCSGLPAGTGSSAQFTSPGIEVSVPDNSSTTFRATATDGAGTSACSSSSITYIESTPPPPPPSPPERGKTVGVQVVGGVVLVRLAGTAEFTVLDDQATIPVGSSIDTSDGRVRLTSATSASGDTQSAIFYDGQFRVLQRENNALTKLRLEGGRAIPCPADRPQPANARSAGATTQLKSQTKQRRKLWGSGKGKFKTKGSGGAATVRGTTWLTSDRCNGTLFRVRSGVVAVRDFARERTVLVRAGERYLARDR